MYGRFGVYLVASLPLEVIAFVFNSTSDNFKFFGMLKLVRLLRLRRIIAFLKGHKTLKFGMKIAQLVFFIILINHWVNCIWRLTTNDEQTWFPPKDLDFRATDAYTGNYMLQYLMFHYYGIIILVGNEVLPTNQTELGVAFLLIFLGTIFIGAVIGEFAAILASITRKERLIADEIDIINNIMLDLRIKEDIQDRILYYYDKLIESRLVKDSSIYEILSPNLVEKVKIHQIYSSIEKLHFVSKTDLNQLEFFCKNIEIKMFLEGDIILKQGYLNQNLYFIHQGGVEVIHEHRDFLFFDYK